MYERVRLVRPVHLDFTGDVMRVGSEATIVDLLDDDIVLLEFDTADEQVGPETVASVYDFVPVH